MLSLYLIALLVGGFLLALSMLGGHDTDVDADFDADADIDADADADADFDGGGFDAIMAWLPFASLRFWTFFAAFFGLTGVILDIGELANPWVGLGIATAVGYVCGASTTRLIRKLRSERVDSSLSRNDCIGETARVVLPVAQGDPGRVRLEIKGRVIELTADTEEESELAVGQRCVIYDVKSDGHAVVARAGGLSASRASGAE